MLKNMIILIVGMLVVVDAQKVVKPQTPVNQTCLSMIEKGNTNTMLDTCEFFKCFEARFPCGDEYWISNWGYKYCRRYADPAFYARFNDNGKKLLKHVNRCLPLTLAKHYSRKSHNCKRLQTEAFKAQGECYSKVQKLFCVAFPQNQNLFTEVLDQSDFFNMESISMIRKVGDKCTPKLDLTKMIFANGEE